MKFLMVIVAFLAINATEANAARWHQRSRTGSFFARATFRPQPIFGGPKMVWRGDWVPAYMVR